MRWRIGMSTGCCLDKPILEVLDAMRDSPIHGVEVGTPPRHFDLWRHAEIAAVKERLERYDITPVSIHAPFGGLLDLTDPNMHHRHAAIGAVLTAAAALRELGGSLVIVHASDVPRNPADVEHRLANCTAALQVLRRACEQMQMVLTLETPLPHLVGGHPDEFRWILDRLGQNMAVCLDTAHSTLGHHWRRFVDVAGERVKHVHASDHHGHRDDHLPPGDGSIDWREIAGGLERIGFDGWIILELSCPNGSSLESHFAHAMGQAARVLA